MEKMKRMFPESDQWDVYCESVLDGYSYKWLQDNKEQTLRLLEFGVASAGGAPPLHLPVAPPRCRRCICRWRPPAAGVASAGGAPPLPAARAP